MIEEEDYKLPLVPDGESPGTGLDAPAGEAAGTAADRKRKADATLAYLKGLPWRPFGWDW